MKALFAVFLMSVLFPAHVQAREVGLFNTAVRSKAIVCSQGAKTYQLKVCDPEIPAKNLDCGHKDCYLVKSLAAESFFANFPQPDSGPYPKTTLSLAVLDEALALTKTTARREQLARWRAAISKWLDFERELREQIETEVMSGPFAEDSAEFARLLKGFALPTLPTLVEAKNISAQEEASAARQACLSKCKTVEECMKTKPRRYSAGGDYRYIPASTLIGWQNDREDCEKQRQECIRACEK